MITYPKVGELYRLRDRSTGLWHWRLSGAPHDAMLCGVGNYLWFASVNIEYYSPSLCEACEIEYVVEMMK